jgi:hypothetical protein
MSRMDLLQPNTGKDGKTYFTRIGVAFPNKSGEGWSLVFQALPMPGPDGCRVLMMPPREQDAPPRATNGRTAQSSARVGGDRGSAPARFDDADSIPFEMEWR